MSAPKVVNCSYKQFKFCYVQVSSQKPVAIDDIRRWNLFYSGSHFNPCTLAVTPMQSTVVSNLVELPYVAPGIVIIFWLSLTIVYCT